MQLSKNYEFWFVTGSQHLYGEETLKQVKENSVKIVEGLNEKGSFEFKLVFKALLTTPDEITNLMRKANADESCAGIVGWMPHFLACENVDQRFLDSEQAFLSPAYAIQP